MHTIFSPIKIISLLSQSTGSISKEYFQTKHSANAIMHQTVHLKQLCLRLGVALQPGTEQSLSPLSFF